VLDFEDEAIVDLSLPFLVALAINDCSNLVARPERRHIRDLGEITRLGWPKCSDSFWPIRRAMMSDALPEAKPTTMRTGRDG
jgi:hypothetical protein